MAKKLDIAKLAERLADLDSKGNGGSSLDFIKIKDGRNVVRILPPADNAEWFAKEVFLHYRVGKSATNQNGSTIVCPTTYGDDKKCPVCELAKELWAMSSKKDDKYDKQAKEVARKKRVYFNAIDRAEDLSDYTKNDEGKWKNTKTDEEGSPVKILATGVGVYKEIMGIIVDPEYGDITDPTEGLDVIITKSGTGFNTSYGVKTVRKESPIGFDEWEECLNDLETLGKTKTYEEIEALMSGEASPSTDDNDGDEEDSTPTKAEKEEKVSDNEEGTPEDADLQSEIKAALERRKKK